MMPVILEPEVAGAIGPKSVVDRSVHPPLVSRLEYVFSGWLGDDLIESFPCFLASKALSTAIETSNLRGAVFDDVLVSVDPQFALVDPDTVTALPEWRWLRPVGFPDDDDFWALPDGRLVVSDRALVVLRRYSLENCEIEELPGR